MLRVSGFEQGLQNLRMSFNALPVHGTIDEAIVSVILLLIWGSGSNP